MPSLTSIKPAAAVLPAPKIIRDKALAAQERLQSLREDVPRLQRCAARRYLEDEIAVFTIEQLELVIPGLEQLAHLAEGQELLHQYELAREHCTAVSATGSYDDRHAAGNRVDWATDRYQRWADANPSLTAEVRSA